MQINRRARLLGGLTLGLIAGLPAVPALAQSGDTDGVTSRLIELLVKRGVLQREDANALLAEAKAEKTQSAKLATKRPKPAPATAAAANTAAKPPEEPVAPVPCG